MKLKVTRFPDLPRLGWIAKIRRDCVHALIGTDVEAGSDFLVEGVWNDPFEGADFHRAEAFFGSGLRLDGGRVFVVPSNSVTDRVLVREQAGSLFASNSLPLLLGCCDLRLDPGRDYTDVGYAIGSGIFEYDGRIPVEGGGAPIRQLYHSMLVIDGSTRQTATRTAVRSFEGFEEYYSRLQRCVDEIAQNARSRDRRSRVRLYSTMSTGYDSPCVSVLARRAGAESCFTAKHSNSLYPSFLDIEATRDDGSEIANCLNLTSIALPEPPTRRELLFRSASCISPELAFDGLADHFEEELGAVCTGFYGDTVWGLTPPGRTDASLRWPDPSGISLSEARLTCGFFSVSVPFIYGRSRESIARISLSDKMSPWRLGTTYDRPIPRRIVEEAGVEREAFGQHKKAILVHRTEPVHPDLRRMYLEWVAHHFDRRPIAYRARVFADRAVYLSASVLRKLNEMISNAEERNVELEPLWHGHSPRDMMFRWAANTVSDRYRELSQRLLANSDASDQVV